MHEGTIAASILQMAAEIAGRENIRNVKRVDVVIGELHHVVAAVLRTHYEIAKADFPALSQSRLRIRTIKARVACRNCRTKSALTKALFLCPSCGSAEIEVSRGMELHLATIEGETDAESKGRGENPQARR